MIVNALLTTLDRGGRTIVTMILLNAAGIPFSLAFMPFWLRENPWDLLTVAAFLALGALYVPWLGFIFPRILRFCWRRDQVWTPARAAQPALALRGGEP